MTKSESEHLKYVLDRLIRQAEAAKSCVDAGLVFDFATLDTGNDYTIRIGDFEIKDCKPPLYDCHFNP